AAARRIPRQGEVHPAAHDRPTARHDLAIRLERDGMAFIPVSGAEKRHDLAASSETGVQGAVGIVAHQAKALPSGRGPQRESRYDDLAVRLDGDLGVGAVAEAEEVGD